ncbi:class I SAM-dependent methyltransferase [Halobacillus locisalis]|uniref:Class I SAM-dependent methyltransferase n=1 Tax=Halobacillus locisalis TaxID=220753 RepID=A0A838CNV2_9BACI|nr:class I SAM-dependent methyltransferase [Halobacillus locisalis]MBA2173737.1 class I SAM-dependent methyltransferase [Halobacillus locisalis]
MSEQELFKGTAYYYANYRPGYPDGLIYQIREFANKQDTLLDLGCGTGELTFPLCKYFSMCIGVDPDSEMIQWADKKKNKYGRENCTFLNRSAEEYEATPSSYSMIVSGNAFHWMNREMVLDQSYNLLEEDGRMVILAGGSLWSGKERWQKDVKKLIQSYLGQKRRAGTGIYPKGKKRHEDYIQQSRFRLSEKSDYTFTYEWTVDSLIGYLYSTSFCRQGSLGEDLEWFEKELRHLLADRHLFEKMEVTCFYLVKSKH